MPPRVASKTVIVVPCYNEEKRLSEDDFLALLTRPDLHLLFVNDGSRDGTEGRLQEISAKGGERVTYLSLEKNSGKAEAVRRGMIHALEQGATVAGYTDADLSTPGDEVLRLLGEMDSRNATVMMGARVALLGSDIRRKRYRHYLGRIFGTTASLLLQLEVYDTQCGAKFFRDTPALRHALIEPFVSRWAFDVELLGRLLAGGPGVTPLTPADFIEVPLRAWRDVAGSKLRPTGMFKAGVDLLRIGAQLRRKRAER